MATRSPAREGQFYNLYHGFVEARPVTAQTSRLLYTLMYDISDKADQAAEAGRHWRSAARGSKARSRR